MLGNAVVLANLRYGDLRRQFKRGSKHSDSLCIYLIDCVALAEGFRVGLAFLDKPILDLIVMSIKKNLAESLNLG